MCHKVNGVSWSVRILRDAYSAEHQLMHHVRGRCWSGATSGYHVVESMMMRMYSWWWVDLGSGPTTSIPSRSNGVSMICRGISGTWVGARRSVCWHWGHRWQNHWTSATIPDQWLGLHSFSSILRIPSWPPSKSAWARCRMVSSFLCGMTSRSHISRWHVGFVYVRLPTNLLTVLSSICLPGSWSLPALCISVCWSF